jgi:hypothetical protein
VVLSDLATPCDVFERAREREGQPCYDARVCGVRRRIKSEHLTLAVPWRAFTLRQAGSIIVPGIYPAGRHEFAELISANGSKTRSR